MEFYPTIGIARGVGTRPEPEHYAVRSLLSTRYLFDYANEDPDYQEYKSSGDFFLVDGETKMPGWSYIDKQNGFLIYENDNYIPMGFTYDQYMTRESYDAMSESRRELALLKALVVEKADEPAVSRMLPVMDETTESFTEYEYADDCADRRAESAVSFARLRIISCSSASPTRTAGPPR